MKQNKKGFTLIELLVVIAIIGLLSTLSILALNTARARARDAKRIADVKQIQTALEMFFNDTGDYPASITPGAAIRTADNIFLAAVPTPPTPFDGATCQPPAVYGIVGGTPTYVYTRTGAASYTITYCLGATISNITGNVIHTASPAGIRLP